MARLGADVGDAEYVAALRWAAHPGCERVVIDLSSGSGSPAGSVGDATVTVLDASGVVRVNLPQAVTRTGIIDTLFDGDLARGAYVVRRADGSLAVDIHIGSSAPAQIRAFAVDSPARIVVDLSPAPAGGTPVAARPTTAGNVVVLSPAPGEATFPLAITGYARTFEASVVARLSVDGSVVAETFTTATDWIDAWGTFTLTFESGPSGEVILFVGEDSARDGTPLGVTFPIDVP